MSVKILVGNTGLVGKTLCESIEFTHTFNTKNIHEFSSIVKDGAEIYLSCLPATKWIVNKNLKRDIENINYIINMISQHEYKKVVLFSTIDVYNDSPLNVDEDYFPNLKGLSYGNNRYLFEMFVQQFVKTQSLKVFRLSALYNKHIKKNILFDLLNSNNVQSINKNSKYQWYNLDNLHLDIEKYQKKYPNEVVFNLFPEPIETQQILELFPKVETSFSNRIEYNYRTKYSNFGYSNSANDVICDIRKFVNAYRK